MSSSVVKVAPLVAADRSPVWAGLESQRDRPRANWAASAGEKLKATLAGAAFGQTVLAKAE